MNWLFAIGFLILAFYLNLKAEYAFFDEHKRKKGLLLNFASTIVFLLALISIM